MKIRKLFQKTAALLMAAVTAVSLVPATTAFAAGDIGTVAFQHTYDSDGNAMRYNSSAVINGHTAGGMGEYKYRMFIDGEVGFCIEPGVPLKTGHTLTKASSEAWNALSSNQRKAVGLALLYGYQGNRNALSGSDDEKWLATQTLVWEFVTGCREATGSYQQTSRTVYDLHFGSNYANSGARTAYEQIVSMLSEYNTIPSFMSGSANDITKELAYNDGKYQSMRSPIDAEIKELQKALDDTPTEKCSPRGLDLEGIRSTLNSLIDFSGSTISHDVVNQFVYMVTPTSDTTFDWYVNLNGTADVKATFTAEGRKKSCIIKLEEIEKISSLHRKENEDNAHLIKNPIVFTFLHRLRSRTECKLLKQA